MPGQQDEASLRAGTAGKLSDSVYFPPRTHSCNREMPSSATLGRGRGQTFRKVSPPAPRDPSSLGRAKPEADKAGRLKQTQLHPRREREPWGGVCEKRGGCPRGYGSPPKSKGGRRGALAAGGPRGAPFSRLLCPLREGGAKGGKRKARPVSLAGTGGDPGRGAALSAASASRGPGSRPPAFPGPGRPAPPSRLPLPSRRAQKTRHKDAGGSQPGPAWAPLGSRRSALPAPHTSWSPQRRRGGNARARGGRRTFHSSLQWNRLAIIGRSQAQTSSAALVGSLHKSAVWLDRKWLRRNQSQRGAPLPEAGLPSLRAASCPPPPRTGGCSR